MNLSHVIIGLLVGGAIGAMDFSLARSIAAMIRPNNARAMQAVMMGGFVIRIGLVGTALWLLSRAGGISFIAVCVGLVGAFTVLILVHAIKAYGGTHKQVSDGR